MYGLIIENEQLMNSLNFVHNVYIVACTSQGKRLDLVATAEHYSVSIGEHPCLVTSLTSTVIQCQLPVILQGPLPVTVRAKMFKIFCLVTVTALANAPALVNAQGCILI